VLDAAGIRLPETVDGVPQLPFEGKSLLPTLTDPHAPDIHTEQYFEIFGNRAIYKDGWVAAAKRDYQPWNLLTDIPRVYADTTDQDHWELYHVATDFSEADDLAAANRPGWPSSRLNSNAKANATMSSRCSRYRSGRRRWSIRLNAISTIAPISQACRPMPCLP
jgi:hypothetical protein